MIVIDPAARSVGSKERQQKALWVMKKMHQISEPRNIGQLRVYLDRGQREMVAAGVGSGLRNVWLIGPLGSSYHAELIRRMAEGYRVMVLDPGPTWAAWGTFWGQARMIVRRKVASWRGR